MKIHLFAALIAIMAYTKCTFFTNDYNDSEVGYMIGIVEKVPDSTADYGINGTFQIAILDKGIRETGKFRMTKGSYCNSVVYKDSVVTFHCQIYSRGLNDCGNC